MAITNNNSVVIDLPAWEVLQPLPVIGAAGQCMTTDKRGTNRNIYMLLSATQTHIYDTYANTYQQIANIPSGVVGAGTDIIFDPSQGSTGRVWAIVATGASTTFQYYDCATNAWTARSITSLSTAFGTDSSLCHTCSTYTSAGTDDYIYMIGGASTAFYRYTISTNQWSTTACSACLSTSLAGCGLYWIPGWDNDRLLRLRGGGNATFDYYTISANTWTAMTFVPATETYTTGSMGVVRGMSADQIYLQKDATMKFYKVDCGDLTIIPQCTQYLVAPGVAHVGMKLCYIKEANGIEFLYYGLPTTTTLMRTALFF
jgi:hypothetical protein